MLERANLLAPELIRLRRDIHQHPELSFQEYRTAELVADTLREIGGINVQTGVGRTGVIGELGTADGPVLAIRADMDALPICEQTEQPYASTNEGVMHACGHDAHTAILLGVAHLLRQSQREGGWHGKVRFLFQPSEEAFDENGISGATAMIQDGALEGVDAVIALHVASDVPSGECHFFDGYSMAAVDSFRAWIYGDGGHGAYPHKGSDPIFMLSQILHALYAIPSRRIDPLHPVVVSLGHVEGGAAPNVIPSEVMLQGTVRTLNKAVRDRMPEEIEKCFRMSELMGGSYRIEYTRGYPSLFNDEGVNNWMRQVTGDLLGAEAVCTVPFGMGAEDFAYMTQAAPGAMFMLGAALPDGMVRNHHTPVFDIDEGVIPKGAAILAETARRFLTGELPVG